MTEDPQFGGRGPPEGTIQLRQKITELDVILDMATQPFAVLDTELRACSANSAFYKLFRLRRPDVEGRSFYQIGKGRWDTVQLRRLFEDMLPNGEAVRGFAFVSEIEKVDADGLRLDAQILPLAGGMGELILLSFEDILPESRAKWRVCL